MSTTERSPGTGQTAAHKPIGYLAARLSKELTNSFDRALGEQHQLGRAQWQLLCGVHDEPGMRPQDYVELVHLTGGEHIRELVDDLCRRGWLRAESSVDGDHLSVTDDGKRNLAQIQRIQDGIGQRLLDGFTDADYRIVVSHLSRMIDNLERP